VGRLSDLRPSSAWNQRTGVDGVLERVVCLRSCHPSRAVRSRVVMAPKESCHHRPEYLFVWWSRRHKPQLKQFHMTTEGLGYLVQKAVDRVRKRVRLDVHLHGRGCDDGTLPYAERARRPWARSRSFSPECLVFIKRRGAPRWNHMTGSVVWNVGNTVFATCELRNFQRTGLLMTVATRRKLASEGSAVSDHRRDDWLWLRCGSRFHHPYLLLRSRRGLRVRPI